MAIGFVQVFAASGALVCFAYWLKSRVMPDTPGRVARRSRQRTRLVSRRQRPQARPAYFEAPLAALPAAALPIPAEAHSERAAEPVRLTIARGERAQELHSRAAVRLESAEYAFRRLLEDLSHVMPLPQRLESCEDAPLAGGNTHRLATRLAA
ncbi:MAG: hypothetical protein KJZ80_11085 [Hyphomicrobiaceae bacterium]|nr:hypothetical protein [Hyphomicrobiaceae bacterium]